MPFPNFHVAEFRRPFGFDRVELGFIRQSFDDRSRRILRSLGFKGVRPEQLLEFRFPVDEWTEQEARGFLKDFKETPKRFFRATGAIKMDHLELALSTAEKNKLPDSAFLLVMGGGDKDSEGKTTPRALRKFAVKRSDGSIDLPRLRIALARIPQEDIPQTTKDKLSTQASGMLEKEKERLSLCFGETDEAAVLAVGIPGGFDPAGEPYKDGNGQPCQKYVKELIRVGEFFKAETDQKFVVTSAKLDHWVDTFEDYTANGNKVPVPNGHDFQGDPDRNRGYCLGMFRNENSLFGVLELVGEDALKAASRADVSIYAPKHFEDGERHSYDWPIRHIALTTDPVINRLGSFIPVAHEKIAAGNDKGPKKVSLYKLTNGADKMDWKKLAKQLGIEDKELTEENAGELILAHVGSVVEAKVKEAKEGVDEKVKKAVDEAKVEFVASHNKTKTKPEPWAIKAIRKGREADIQTLVLGRHITPGCAAGLKKRHTSDEAIALSHQGDDDEFDNWVEDLKKNDAKELFELKVENGLVLDRKTPIDDPNEPKAPTAEEMKTRRDRAYGVTSKS